MFCKHCGKEIKDGVKFCPMCGKPTGATTEKKEKSQNKNNPFQNKKPNPKLLFAILGVVVIVFFIGKKFFSPDHTQDVASNETISNDYANESYTEDVNANESYSEDSNTNSDESKFDYKDKKLKRKRSYKRAYKEEYNSFEARIEEYCQKENEEYFEMVDKVADGFNAAYEGLEKAVPNLSTYIGLDVGNAVSDSYTGVGVVSELTKKALGNEEVRKIGAKTVMYVGTALWNYAIDSTTTDYPFGFSLIALNKDYALLRSNGTYEDMEKIISRSMSYSLKVEMLDERIKELKREAGDLIDGEDKDAYNECMGRLAANEDLKKEVKEFYQKCMAVIACSGNGYCFDTTQSIKLYWVVSADDTIHNTFWAPHAIGSEGMGSNFDMSLCEDGSCFLTRASGERFVLNKDRKKIFDGISLEQLSEAPVGESAILTYSSSGKALQKRKVKDDTYGTYYIIEIVDKKGKAEKVLEVRETQVVQSKPHYEGGVFSGINWYDAITDSDYAVLEYETLDKRSEKSVIDLSTGKVYNRKEFEKIALEEALKSKGEGQPSAQKGILEDGWIWNVETGGIFVENDVIFMEHKGFTSELSAKYTDLNKSDQVFDASKFIFDKDTFLKNIGESREVIDCYCKDNVVWVVTRSGYFYTYDLESKKKSKEVEIGENVPHAYTPYGLIVCGKNEKGKAKIEYEGYSGKETENSVYQYDASGKCIAKYPAYTNSLEGCVYQFLYCSGRDTYNLATKKMFEMQ